MSKGQNNSATMERDGMVDVRAEMETFMAMLSKAIRDGAEGLVDMMLGTRWASEATESDFARVVCLCAGYAQPRLLSRFLSMREDWGPALSKEAAMLSAVMGESAECVEALAKAGVEVDGFDMDGARPLTVAASRGCVEVCETLLRWGAKPQDTLEENGHGPLFCAVVKGKSADCAKLLLDAGADPSLVDPETGSSLLSRLSKWSRNEDQKRASGMAGLLIAEGARVDEPDREGKTPLMHAVFANNAEAVKTLLAAGADGRAKVPMALGETLLEIAVRMQVEESALALLECCPPQAEGEWRAVLGDAKTFGLASVRQKAEAMNEARQIAKAAPMGAGQRERRGRPRV